MSTETLSDNVSKLTAMLSPGFDWDAHWKSYDAKSPDEMFRACCTLLGDEWPERFACGGYKADNTPDSLYRLLFLLRPKVDFSDMYTSWLFAFTSADGRFIVSVELFKYELGLYFYAPKDCVGGKGTGIIIGGWPGADNERHCTDEDGRAFFDMVIKAVEHEWTVYGGNDFVV